MAVFQTLHCSRLLRPYHHCAPIPRRPNSFTRSRIAAPLCSKPTPRGCKRLPRLATAALRSCRIRVSLRISFSFRIRPKIRIKARASRLYLHRRRHRRHCRKRVRTTRSAHLRSSLRGTVPSLPRALLCSMLMLATQTLPLPSPMRPISMPWSQMSSQNRSSH